MVSIYRIQAVADYMSPINAEALVRQSWTEEPSDLFSREETGDLTDGVDVLIEANVDSAHVDWISTRTAREELDRVFDRQIILLPIAEVRIIRVGEYSEDHGMGDVIADHPSVSQSSPS